MRHTIIRVLIAWLAGAVAVAAGSQIPLGVRGSGYLTAINLYAHTFNHSLPTDGTVSGLSLLIGYSAILVATLLATAFYAFFAIGAGLRDPTLILIAIAYANIIWVIGDYIIWGTVDVVASRLFPTWIVWLAHSVFGLVIGIALLGVPPRKPPTLATSGPATGMGYPGEATRPRDQRQS